MFGELAPGAPGHAGSDPGWAPGAAGSINRVQVDYAFVAESADVQSGLFYVVRGGTDIWNTPPDANFPVPIGPMSFVVRLVGDPSEIGRQHAVEFTVVDADGRSIGVGGTGSIELAPHAIDRTRSGAALLHFRLGFTITAPGAYFFELHSQGTRLCQVPFWVLRSNFGTEAPPQG